MVSARVLAARGVIHGSLVRTVWATASAARKPRPAAIEFWSIIKRQGPIGLGSLTQLMQGRVVLIAGKQVELWAVRSSETRSCARGRGLKPVQRLSIRREVLRESLL